MAKLKANKPTADVLMNSMRAMGYSFEAAIADIVDNSVGAQARNIVLRFPIDPADCCVAVCDDGNKIHCKHYGESLECQNVNTKTPAKNIRNRWKFLIWTMMIEFK